MATAIELDDIHKVYDTGAVKVHALRGVSLSVLDGEFVAIMGQSGSGKSTLLNLIGCLDHPTNGRYRLGGVDVSQLNPQELAHIRNRQLGFVFQGFNLLKRYSAVDNVSLPLLYSGITASERRKRALAMLQLVGLSDRADHMPNQLSGGQQQRVAIARALVNEPRILLADEPTGNLDSRTGEEILREFQRLNRERKQTIVIVTHEAGIAHYALRRIVVKDGLIEHDECTEAGLRVRDAENLQLRDDVPVPALRTIKPRAWKVG
jgi:putative ABC transport system ATP-binding protein